MEKQEDEKIDVKVQEQDENKQLIVPKKGFLIRVTHSIKKFFFKGKMKNLLLEDGNKIEANKAKIKFIHDNPEFVQEYISNARRAFRKYVINNSKSISIDIFSLIKEKIKENKSKIEELIKMNEDDVTYASILKMLEKEEKAVSEFKAKDKETERYNVPIGVIGVECDSSKNAIENIFKSIATRNSIIILHSHYNKYSTEALILLIVKECIKNFSVDDNIVQMYEDNVLQISQLDKLIKKGKNKDKPVKELFSKTIYIYLENDEYEDEVMKEYDRLKKDENYKEYEIQLINGEFANIINFLNRNASYAVCMYTSNDQKAYKFINWIDSPNVFVNTGIQVLNEEFGKENKYYHCKYVLYKDVF